MTSSISSKDTFLLSGSFEWSPVSSLHASREEPLAGSTSPESPWSPTCSQGVLSHAVREPVSLNLYSSLSALMPPL